MKLPAAIVGALLAAIVIFSFAAPTTQAKSPVANPFVEAQSNNACQGLRNAYNACNQGGNPANCAHILEQMFAHGCVSSSSSGSR